MFFGNIAEKAAPVVLESPILDTHRWGELVALAEEMGLSDEQFRRTIAELRERGVIQRIELAAPKPPPLPNQAGSSKERTETSDSDEADFSLTPPPPPPRAMPAESRKPPHKRVEKIEQFRRMAIAIIARHRGTGPKAQILLVAAAEELGLPEEVAREALRTLHPAESQTADDKIEPPIIVQRQGARASPVVPAPADDGARYTAEEEARRRRWRVEGEPDPDPPPPTRSPDEIYRDYIQQSLDPLRDTRVSSDLERRMLRHGVRVLGLSNVYAGHLLNEIADEKHLLLPSAAKRRMASELPDVDPKLRSFLDSAAPVLAQHRGINAKSRVMLTALAREQGLSDAQMEKALTLLQHRPATDGNESLQAERLEAFRHLVRTALSKLPHAILTANILSKLVEQGRLLYGVEEERLGPLIREVAESLKVSVVTQEQAERHVEQLVADLMGESVRLSPDVRERIHAEGRQWGLAEEQVEATILGCSQSNLRRRRSERNFTNVALVAASLALLFLIGFISWTMIEDQLKVSDKPPAVEVESPPVPPPPDPDKDDSWWQAELSIAVAMTRQEFPQLRAPLMDVAAVDPQRRGAAYEQLAKHLLEDAINDFQRSRLMDVLSWCYALDPDDATADRIASALLGVVPAPEASLNEDADAYSRVFWATRTAIAALEQSREDGARAERMARALGRAVGSSVDYQQAPRELERQCLGALAERLYRLLISAAAIQPEAVSIIHLAIAAEAARYLDGEILDNLNADFLVALIPAAAGVWRQYEELITQTINSPHALAVVKLVDLYERTENKELQGFMSGLLLRRAGSLPSTHTVTEIADEVRRGLGVGEGDLSEDRWVLLSREASRVLARTKAASQPDELMLQDVIDLAHLATLGCALSQDELGITTFDDLRAKGAPRLKDEVGLPSLASSTRGSGGSMGMLDQSLKMLHNRRISWVGRIERLAYLARAASKFADVQPRQAETLASYLLKLKTVDEHTKALEHVKAIARWKHLRLAIADGIMEAKLRPEHLQSLLAEILGREIKLGGRTAGREEARSRLLESVLSELNSSAVRSAGPCRSYDVLRSQLRERYDTQNQLLSAAPDDASWSSPTQVLHALVEGYAAKLGATIKEPPAQRELDRIPHELTAAGYVAANDLELTVLLERQWIRVLAQAVAGRHPGRQKEIDNIRRELVSADRNAAHIAQQLRDGQAAIVRLWLLWNKPE
ncbi:MAG: hypothetical protein ACC628_22120 [Pirellulaceae bacterium]